MNKLLQFDMNNPDIYQDKVWGNTENLSKLLGRDLSKIKEGSIGEVFIVSSHKDGLSRFTNGKTIDETINSIDGRDIFGDRIVDEGRFPLLMKILSANQKLSIQNHYNNKIEAWITLSKGSMLYGLTKEGEKMFITRPDFMKDLLYESQEVNQISRYFNVVNFNQNETYLIQAGMVHALLEGTIYEPQKNCNLTNRGGDWGRKDPKRPLHWHGFSEALHYFHTAASPIYPVTKKEDSDCSISVMVATQDFAVESIKLKGRYEINPDGCPLSVLVSEGKISINGQGMNVGDSGIMPASGEYMISGEGSFLLTYTPNIIKDIIKPLLARKTEPQHIAQLGGPIAAQNDVRIQMLEKGYLNRT
jgi:mannose-6-phosphate isomerase